MSAANSAARKHLRTSGQQPVAVEDQTVRAAGPAPDEHGPEERADAEASLAAVNPDDDAPDLDSTDLDSTDLDDFDLVDADDADIQAALAEGDLDEPDLSVDVAEVAGLAEEVSVVVLAAWLTVCVTVPVLVGKVLDEPYAYTPPPASAVSGPLVTGCASPWAV